MLENSLWPLKSLSLLCIPYKNDIIIIIIKVCFYYPYTCANPTEQNIELLLRLLLFLHFFARLNMDNLCF